MEIIESIWKNNVFENRNRKQIKKLCNDYEGIRSGIKTKILQ